MFGEAFTSRNVLRETASLPAPLAVSGSPAVGISMMVLEAGPAVETDPRMEMPTIGTDGTGASILVLNCEMVDKVGTSARDDSLKGRRSEIGGGRSSLL